MEQTQESSFRAKASSLFDKNYKLLLIIPAVLLILSLFYLYNFYSVNNDFILKDVGLSGGTTITLNAEQNSADFDNLEAKLPEKHSDAVFRKLADLRTGEVLAVIIESQSEPDILKADIEEILGYELNTENSSIEFSGSSLGSNFYKQLILALAISFLLISIVIFLMFRALVPSISIILVAFADIVMPLALVDYLGIKLSAAGIAAFLMLIGYCVDDNILLTTRAIRNRENTLNSRIFRAFKTGIFMSSTALLAIVPAFFLITGLPDSFRQIFLILALGLSADIINTWMTNLGIIKWYCEKHNIN